MNITIATLSELLVEFLAKRELWIFLTGEFWGRIPVGRLPYLPIRLLNLVFVHCCLAVLATMPLAL